VVLKKSVPLQAGEVIDASFMSVVALDDFFEREMQDAKDAELMLSLHLKATMMKVSDPIMFGHAIRVFFKDAFAKHGDVLLSIGANPNQGLGSLLDTVRTKLPADQAATIVADFDACYADRPWLAMVDSDKGITNLHAPNDVIVDASMPVVVRDSGKMWNKLGELEDVKCLIPDRCYATTYQEVLSYVKTKGQFDVSTMGSVVSVTLPLLHNVVSFFLLNTLHAYFSPHLYLNCCFCCRCFFPSGQRGSHGEKG
jgi:isocitrate dehydrogenase